MPYLKREIFSEKVTVSGQRSEGDVWVSRGRIFQAVRDPIYGPRCQKWGLTSLHLKPKAVYTSLSENWIETLVLPAV